MAKYKQRVVEIEAITFDELVEFGRNNGANIVNGMPWSFGYKGNHISHENDTCYLIPTHKGTKKLTPVDMLINKDGELDVLHIISFNIKYELVNKEFANE